MAVHIRQYGGTAGGLGKIHGGREGQVKGGVPFQDQGQGYHHIGPFKELRYAGEEVQINN